MLIVLPLLLVFQNVIFGLSAPTEFNLNITVHCKSKINWCYEIKFMEEDLIKDDELAKTYKQCIDNEAKYANHIMHGSIGGDGPFNSFAEIYVDVSHNCNKDDKTRRIEHYLGNEELIPDKVYNFEKTIDLDETGADRGFILWRNL